jgi:hypothetical protein
MCPGSRGCRELRQVIAAMFPAYGWLTAVEDVPAPIGDAQTWHWRGRVGDGLTALTLRATLSRLSRRDRAGRGDAAADESRAG